MTSDIRSGLTAKLTREGGGRGGVLFSGEKLSSWRLNWVEPLFAEEELVRSFCAGEEKRGAALSSERPPLRRIQTFSASIEKGGRGEQAE